MGFLSGAFSSESSTRTTTTSQNAGQSEVGGGAYSFNITGGGKRSTVTPTVNVLDGGAVQGGFDIASQAINSSNYGLDAALDFANVQGNRASEVAFDSVKLALDSSTQAFSDALHLTRDTLDVLTTSQQDALDRVTSNQQSALSSVSALATRNSSTESDRISKLATYALFAVAALVILPKVFGK